MKQLWLTLLVTFSLGAFSQHAQANTEEPQQFKPSVALLVDYIDTRGDMFGVTIAARHFDPDYADWGYYIGYAWGSEYDIEVPEPAGEGYAKEYMWRFGLSYSLTQDLSLYGGATVFIYEENTTDNIVPLIVGAEPVWERDRQKDWGAEFGIRYTFMEGFVIGAGYDTSAEAAIISFGFTI